MHVSREKMNGSKSLQLISNTHLTAYWLSNYIFDFTLCLVNISLMVAMFAMANAVRSETATDIHLLTATPTLSYLYLILFLSSLNWATYAYCWSFFFKSDVTAFVVLFFMFGIMAFLDVGFSFIQLFVHITDETVDSNTASSRTLYLLRILLCVLFPNVTLKRGMFNFRLRSSKFCIDSLNDVLKSRLFFFLFCLGCEA